jgi:hypothetical protein
VRVARLEPVFVGARPDVLEPGNVYVSIPFRTSVHLCCCGCGNEVWMPIRPDRWKVTYDGVNISFSPSVGNWSLPCQSHYWIRASRVDWAPPSTPRQKWWKRLARLRVPRRPRA